MPPAPLQTEYRPAHRGRWHRRPRPSTTPPPPLTAAAYGAGAALILDELALLIDLQDVYWANEGRTSVDAAFGALALGGLYLAGVPFWHGADHEIARTST